MEASPNPNPNPNPYLTLTQVGVVETVGKLGHPFCSGLNRLTLASRTYDSEKKKKDEKKEDSPARLVGW